MVKVFGIAIYQLYLMQLESYEMGRFLKLLFKKGLWPKGEQRKSLVWTVKARVVFSLAVILHLAGSFVFFWFVSEGLSVLSTKDLVLSIGLFSILYSLYFILYAIAILLLWPLDFILKALIVQRAKAKIRNAKDLKIIGIAGSYGKTTMKEVLKTVLSTKYLVLSTPESVNTPVGIARWILKEFLLSDNNPNTLSTTSKVASPPEGEKNSVVALVEMGEHYRGDVEEICNIVKPDTVVVTGINEAHLERMKNLETSIATIFEAVSGTQAGGLVVLNGDDKNVMAHYKEYVWPDHIIEKYQVASIKYPVFDQESLCWNIEVEGIGKIKVNLLGEYGLGDVDAAVKIAKYLGMGTEEIKKGVSNLKPLEHRLQPIKSGSNVLVIDDSYNGNPEGVREAIKVLGRFEGRRKLYITPGLVEIGKASEEIHSEIGRQLAGTADVVILIKNSVTKFIEEGLALSLHALSPGVGESRREVGEGFQPLPSPLQFLERETDRKVLLYWFDTAPEAHAGLKDILKPGDVIVFQNDWGDQYV